MKQGKTLNELAMELTRQRDAKKDYLAHTSRIKLETTANDGVILQGVNGGMQLKPTAHAQMAATLQIPKPYYDRMLAEAPDLLTRNVNTWLERNPAKKLVRTLDNQVRAILSDSYRPRDNYDVATALLPVLQGLDAQTLSCEVTESRLYLKAVTPKIQGQVKVGDTIQAGLMVSNSEIGMGATNLADLDFRLVCLNGMVREKVLRSAHIGRRDNNGFIEESREYFTTMTRQLEDSAYFAKLADVAKGMFSQERFDKRIAQYAAGAGRMIEAKDIPAVVEVTGKKFGFNDGERASILEHLIKGGDLSQWGLANAVTRAAQDVESYDRSTELEKIGGDVIELSPSEWKVLAV